MGYSKPTHFTEWSFTRWIEWKGCAFKAKCKRILKLKEPGSPALDNGNTIHLYAMTYVGGVVPELQYMEEPRSAGTTKLLKAIAKGLLTKELRNFADEFKALRTKKYKTEEQLVLKKDWTLTVWNDWDNAWCRVKLDAHRVDGRSGIIVDYKTGKRYPEKHDDAMELYALVMFIVYPQLEEVYTALWYLDISDPEQNVSDRTFTRDEVPGLKKLWEKRVMPMLSDKSFKASPSNLCRYCHFRKENGGPCTK